MDPSVTEILESSGSMNMTLWDFLYHKRKRLNEGQTEGGHQSLVDEVLALVRQTRTFLAGVLELEPDEEEKQTKSVDDLSEQWTQLERFTLKPRAALERLQDQYPHLTEWLGLAAEEPAIGPEDEVEDSDLEDSTWIHPSASESPTEPQPKKKRRKKAALGRKPQVKTLGPQEYVCGEEGCPMNQVFPSAKALKSHFYAEHVSEQDFVFKCEYCDDKFSHPRAKWVHERNKHLKKYECELCGLKVVNAYQLERHHWTHTGEKPYHCDQCSYKSARKSNLDKHKQEKHGDFGGRDCFCEICGVPFQTPWSLKYHIKMTHIRHENQPPKDDKPYPCDRCEYKFSSQYHLNQHIYAKHEFDGVKKFCCELCGKSYKSANTLKGHLRFVHWGEKRKTSSKKTD